MKRGTKAETLRHYDRMIAWAEEQNGDARIYYHGMLNAIKEGWHSEGCPVCKENIGKNPCPLKRDNNICYGVGCCGTLWKTMNDALTWSDWIKAAKQVRAFIKKTPFTAKDGPQ